MKYKTCPLCGANLDPGERCDCNKKTLSVLLTLTTAVREMECTPRFPPHMITEKHGGFKHENE